MKIGAHVSIAGGIFSAPANAKTIGAECFQMFSRSPRGGGYGTPDKETVKTFLAECQLNGYEIGKDYVIHSPYYINLASTNNRIYYGSINALKAELKTAHLIKCPYVITHIGSSRDLVGKDVQKQINELVLKALRKIHEDLESSSMLLLEIAAGSGNIIGDSFEEIGFFIQQAKKEDIQLGFCLDTCHAFAAGYDQRTEKQVEKMFADLEKFIGWDNLKIIHFNDSHHDFDSHKDMHAHLGKGKIGIQGLEKTAQMAKAKNINLIIETRHDKIKEDIQLMKNLRDSALLV